MAKPLSEMSLEELDALEASLLEGLGGLPSSGESVLERAERERYAGGNALTRGLSRGVDVAQMGYGSALEGIGKVAGLEGLQQYGGDIVAEQEQELAAKSPYATRLQDVKDAEGILGTTGALASFTGSALGESLPQMGTTLGGSLAGAAAGARAGMVAGLPGAIAGGIAGGLLANVPFFYGMNREAQKEAIEQGYRTEMSEGAAFLASIPQSTMDLISDRLLVGLGPKVGVNIEKLSRQGGLFTRGAKGAALGATVEIPTELGQQLIERYQAGMPIDSPEAIDEYLEVMAAAGLVGGSIRGATNVIGGDPKAREEREEKNKKEAEEAERLKIQKDAEDEKQRRIDALVSGKATQGTLDFSPTEEGATAEAVTEEATTPLAVEIKKHRRNLEQYRVDDVAIDAVQLELGEVAGEKPPRRKTGKPKFEYADPTAGLAPELVNEKDQKLDEIYQLKINTPPDVDADTLADIEKKIKTKEQAISDLDVQINDFVKKNKKDINAERKNSATRLKELEAANAPALGVVPEEVVAYETVGGEQVSLFDLPLVEQEPAKVPLVFAQGEARVTGDKLLESGEYVEEDFQNPLFLRNVKSGRPITAKESGLSVDQIENVKKNKDAYVDSQIILDELGQYQQGDFRKGFENYDAELAGFRDRFDNPQERPLKLANDLKKYRTKVDAQIKKDVLREKQGFLYNNDKVKELKQTIRPKLSNIDIREAADRYEIEIDLDNVKQPDIRKIANAKKIKNRKTAAERREAKKKTTTTKKVAKKVAKKKVAKKKVAKKKVAKKKVAKKKVAKKKVAKKKVAKKKTTAKGPVTETGKAAEKLVASVKRLKKTLAKRKKAVKKNVNNKNEKKDPTKINEFVEKPPEEESLENYFVPSAFEAYKEYKAKGEMPFTYEDIKKLEKEGLIEIEVTKTGKIKKSTLDKLVKKVESIRNLKENANQNVINTIGKADIDLLNFTKASKNNPSGSYGELNKLKGQKDVAIEALKADMIDAAPNNVDVLDNVRIKLESDSPHGLSKENFGVVGQGAEGVGSGAIGSGSDSPFKLAFPYTGSKFGLEFFNSLDLNEQLIIIKDVIEARTPVEAPKTKVQTRKKRPVFVDDDAIVDDDISGQIKKLEKEILKLQDSIESAETRKDKLKDPEKIQKGETLTAKQKIEKEIAELNKDLDLKTTKITNLLGYGTSKVSKEEKQADGLDEIRNMAALELGQTRRQIDAEQKKAGFGVKGNKETLAELRKKEKDYEKAYKEADKAYVDFVEKTTTKKGKYIEDNPLAGTRHGVLSEEKRGLQYLEEDPKGQGFATVSVLVGVENRSIPKEYSIPFEEKVYPKTTVAKVKAAILDKFGKAGVNRITVATNPKKAGLTNINPTAAGVVIDGKPYLFTDNIAEGNELGVLLHELGVHVGMPALVGQGNYKFLINKIKQFADANDGSRESQLAKRAFDRVRQAEKVVDVNRDDELIAYFVEEAVNSGVNPSAELVKKSKLGMWFRRFMAGVKNLFSKQGLKGDFTAQDFVDIAYGGADFAIRNPNMKITNAEKAIQYSVAMPMGSGIEKLNAPFRSINNAMPEWSQNVIDSLLNNVSNLPDYLKKVWYNLLSLRQMADTVDRFGEKYKPIADGIRKLNTLVNQRRFNIDQERLRWQSALLDAQSHKEGYSDADLKEFYDIVHESTLEEIDLRSNESEVTSTDLYKRYMKVVNKSSDLNKYDLRKSYKIMADMYAKAGQRLLDFYQKTTGETLTAKQKKELGFIQDAEGRITPYFPLVREGSWWIDYVAADGDTYTLSYETKRQAEQAAKEIEQDPANKIEYKKGSSIYQRVRNDELNDTANIKILTEVQRALEKALPTGPEKDQAISQLKDTILKSYPSESLKQQFKRRKGTKGFRQDVFQNFAHMGLKFSNELSLLDNVDPLNEAIGALEQFSEGGKTPPAVANILDSIQRRSSFMRNPTPGAISSKLAYGGYTWFILGNISSAVVNLSQIPLVTYGLLAGEFGHAKAVSAIAKGFKNYFKFHQDNNTRLTAFGMPLADRTAFGGSFIDESTPEGREMKTLFDAALANGIVRRTTSQELQEAKFNRIDSVTGNMVRAEMALGYVFQNSERANREVSLLAAYQLAKEKYGNKKVSKDSDVTVAMERAFELVEQANGPALAEAGPQYFQTGPGKVIGTFKRFALSQLYLQYKLLRDITRPLKDDPKIPETLKGKVPSARTLAIRQFRSIIIPAWLFAGAKGLPFYGAAEVAANLTDLLIPGDDEDDLGLDFNMTVRKAMGDVAFRGPISHFTNLDFASRTGFYGLMYRDDPYRRAEVGDLTYFGESLLGPAYAAFIRNPSKAIDKFRDGDLYGAVQSASPSFVRNILKAGSFATEGALNSKGVPIVEDVNGYNVMMQLFGFTPTDLSNAYQANEILSRQSRKIASRRSKLLLELNMAKNAGDTDGELSILEDINSFNGTEVVINTQQQIGSSTVKRSYDAFVDYITGSVRGLRVNEKMRPGLIEQTGIEDPEDM